MTDASLIARAVGRQEAVRGIFARQPLRRFGVFHQETRTAAAAGTAWPPDPADREIRPGGRGARPCPARPQTARPAPLHGQIQVAQRIHEERGAPANFVAQHGDAGARVIEGFNDHVFQFVAQELFDGALVLRFDFGVIGQHADGAEVARVASRRFEAKSFCTASAV